MPFQISNGLALTVRYSTVQEESTRCVLQYLPEHVRKDGSGGASGIRRRRSPKMVLQLPDKYQWILRIENKPKSEILDWTITTVLTETEFQTTRSLLQGLRLEEGNTVLKE